MGVARFSKFTSMGAPYGGDCFPFKNHFDFVMVEKISASGFVPYEGSYKGLVE